MSTSDRIRDRIPTLIATLCIASTVAAAPLATPGERSVDIAASVDDHLVVVGADDPGSPSLPSLADRLEYHAYYPDTLQIHRGDVVRFRYEGEHSVTFYPGGERQDTLLVPDELPTQIRLDGLFPSRDDCNLGAGREHLPPCVLSSPDQYLNAGASPPNLDYTARVQIDLPPGSYAYFCIFHPAMRGEIEVVADEEEIPTPAEVEAERRTQVQADTAAAEAVIAAYEGPPREIVGDRSRWQVQVGGSTPDGRVAILGYLPVNLTIEPGDEVEFVLPPMPGGDEGHSVSFLPDDVRPFTPLHYYEFRCDVDGRDTGAPGAPGALAFLAIGSDCPEGELEMLWAPQAFAAPLRSPGNVVAGPRPVHDSGALLTPQEVCHDSCDPWTGQPLPDRFEATFPQEGTFTYWCFLHDPRGMAGSITVSG